MIYKKIDLKPNTDAWHKWRHGGIGSSDIPVIMGVSPYKSKSKLFNEKIDPDPPREDNNNHFIKNLGHRAEAILFATININMMMNIKPLLCESTIYDWAKASIDGFCDGKIYEVKLCGREKMELVKEGNIPDEFLHQIYWQMYVTGARCAYLCAVPFIDRDIEISETIYKKITLPDDYHGAYFNKIEDFYMDIYRKINYKPGPKPITHEEISGYPSENFNDSYDSDRGFYGNYK